MGKDHKKKSSKTKKERKVVMLDRDDKEKNQRAYAETFNIAKAMHPIGCVFHMLFKSGAGLCFLFMGLFTNSSVKIFVFTMVLSCLDFWVTKNVTGRLLVGLRWWSGSDLTQDDVIGPLDQEDQKSEDNDVSIALKNLKPTKDIAAASKKLTEAKEAIKDSEKVAKAKEALKNIKDEVKENIDDVIDMADKAHKVELKNIEEIKKEHLEIDKKQKERKRKEESESESEEEENSEDDEYDDSESEESMNSEELEQEKFRGQWFFESYDYDIQNSFVDTHIFWWSQAASTIFWAIFLVINALALSMFWVSLHTFRHIINLFRGCWCSFPFL